MSLSQWHISKSITATSHTRSFFAASRARNNASSSGADSAESVLLTEISDDGFATLTLNRPAVHNALSDELASKLKETFAELKGMVAYQSVFIMTGCTALHCICEMKIRQT